METQAQSTEGRAPSNVTAFKRAGQKPIEIALLTMQASPQSTKPMKSHFPAIALFASMIAANARIVTLTVAGITDTNGSVTEGLTEMRIEAYEVAELLSFPRWNGASPATRMEILKDGKALPYYFELIPPTIAAQSPFDPLIVAGPAVIRFRSSNQTGGMCTFKITPEAFPPDRTILVPPGTNQACVTLECSTNLVQWFAATNGVYGPLPEAKFFRIKLEPMQ